MILFVIFSTSFIKPYLFSNYNLQDSSVTFCVNELQFAGKKHVFIVYISSAIIFTCFVQTHYSISQK